MSFVVHDTIFANYACDICGTVRTYGTGQPDRAEDMKYIACKKCQTNTPHHFKEVTTARIGLVPRFRSEF